MFHLNKPGRWVQWASFGILAFSMALLPTWAADISKVTDIKASAIDNQVILNLSSDNQATLSSPIEKGQRRLLLDIQGASILETMDKKALLNSIQKQLPDIDEVTLDEFRGPNPMVRLMVKTKDPNITGALLHNEGNILVLQLLSPPEKEQSATPTAPGLTVTQTPPAQPVKRARKTHTPVTPVATQPTPVVAETPTPQTQTWTPPPEKLPEPGPHVVEAAAPQPLPAKPSPPRQLEPSPDQLPQAVLTAKTSHEASESRIERKDYEADSLRMERNRLRDQMESLKILVDQQNTMIATLKAQQEQIAAQPTTDKGAKKQVLSLQKQADELQKSYDQMSHILEGYRNEVSTLEDQLREAQDHVAGVNQQLAASNQIKFPDAGEARAGLLNTLSDLTQAEVNNLIDAEKSFRDAKKFEFQGDSQKAESKYLNALHLAPQVQDYALSLGTLYFRQKRYPEAKNILLAALQYHPDDSNLLNELGKVSLLQKDELQALGYFKKAIPAGVLSNYASTLRRANRLEEAEALYKIAISINPDDSDLQFNLGNLYLSQKRFPEAQQRFNEAVTLKPDFAEAHFHMGLAYAEQGNADKATAEFNSYLKLMPDAPNKDAVKDYIRDLLKSVKPS